VGPHGAAQPGLGLVVESVGPHGAIGSQALAERHGGLSTVRCRELDHVKDLVGEDWPS
jgi:hypothetical protein